MAEERRNERPGRPGTLVRRSLLGGLAVAGAGAAAGAFALTRTPVGLAPGRSRARPVAGAARPPAAVDVVVIGGGFIGAATALTLAERGVSVALCEKGVIAGEASGRSMGFVYSQYEAADKFPLLSRAVELWGGMNARTGMETGYRRSGIVGPLATAAEAAGAEAWLASLRGAPGLTGRMLGRQEISRLYPDMRDPPASTLFTDMDGSVEPTLAAPAMAEAAQRKGAFVIQGCAVRGLEFSAGRVSSVVTEKGPIACQAVVLAGGAWTPLFAGSLGVPVTQVDLYLSMLALNPFAGPAGSLSAADYGFRRQIDGGYSVGVIDLALPIQPRLIKDAPNLIPQMGSGFPPVQAGFSPGAFWEELRTPSRWPLDRVSPFERRRILEPVMRAGPVEQALAKLRHQFPAFARTVVRERWSGAMSIAPDQVPVISPVASRPGLYIGSGFADGLTYAPAAGEALADLVMGRPLAVNLHMYRLER